MKDIELIRGVARIVDPRMDMRINHDERVDMADAIYALADRMESAQAANEVIALNALRYLILATDADWCVINETDGMKYSHEELDAALDSAMEKVKP